MRSFANYLVDSEMISAGMNDQWLFGVVISGFGDGRDIQGGVVGVRRLSTHPEHDMTRYLGAEFVHPRVYCSVLPNFDTFEGYPQCIHSVYPSSFDHVRQNRRD